ncbi:MAG: hypothetical protein IJ229_07475 [Clostridia bacterium]|nr:hypothetical protein [Clostridia bacterium]MBR1684612.1 hypothetical protein [Clostridia bacterium]MBR2288143.1 hypothetical protein [Clostridia bacterium]
MNTALLLALTAGSLFLTGTRHPVSAQPLPEFRGICEVRSNLPGRLRLALPAIKSDPEQAQHVCQQLLSTGVVREATANPATASLLICYDASQVEAPLLMGAVIRLMGLDEQITRKERPRLEKQLHQLYMAVDRSVLDASGGWIDSRLLAGGALLAAAIRQGLTGGYALPGAVTLLWWASSIFRKGNEDT